MEPVSSATDAQNGTKRKAEEASGPVRAKRNRYISIACNECKRRKIKCNGNNPCQRCGNLNLECIYAPNCCGSNFKDSQEWQQMEAHVTNLQAQVDALFAEVSSLRNELAAGGGGSGGGDQSLLDPSLQASTSYHLPAAAGNGMPASPAPMSPLDTDVRPTNHQQKKSIRATGFRGSTGITPDIQTGGGGGGVGGGVGGHEGRPEDVTPATSPKGTSLSGPPPNVVSTGQTQAKDPIWMVSKDEAVRLLAVYEGEMHEMYPIVSLVHLRRHTDTLYRFLDAFLRADMARLDRPGSDGIYDKDTNILKLVMAIALLAEEKAQGELGRKLFECVQPQLDGVLLGNAGLKQIRLLALAAVYNFHCDNEGTSWRIIGLTARLCIEMGLHRKETYDQMSPEDAESAILLFWSIYSLDRSWSFGTGMVFAIQDSDLDPNLPKPDNKSPYLAAMIHFWAIDSKVSAAIGSAGAKSISTNLSSTSMTREDINSLDFEIRQWHRNLPSSLQFSSEALDTFSPTFSNPGNTRLRIILYLRQNGMLINIYRPVLHSTATIMRSMPQAEQLVAVAKDTIRALTSFHATSDMYRSSQVLFHPFLTSALAVLLQAVSHAPTKFVDSVRDEFHQALDLVRGFSRDSWVSKRIWKTIRALKEAMSRHGLNAVNADNNSNNNMTDYPNLETSQARITTRPTAPYPSVQNHEIEDPSRSAALAMADLAGQGSLGPPSQRASDPFDIFPATPTGWQTSGGDSNSGSGGIAGDAGGRSGVVSGSSSIPTASPDQMANDLSALFEAVGTSSGVVEGRRQGLDGEGDGVGGEDGGGVEVGGGGEEELSRILGELF